jgi:predicted metal-dependent phosphoesterase TrpH
VEQGDSDRVLGDLAGCWQRVCHIEFAIGDVIETIHRAGGVAVLAHPSVVFRPDGDFVQAEDLASLIEMGLDGIEVYHYRLTDEATRQHFAGLARRFDLAISGGSDYHARPESPAWLGSEPITDQMVAALEARRR